jgi:hypothetical protein
MWRCRAASSLRAASALLGLAGALAPGAWGQVQVTVDRTPVVFTGQPPVEQGGRVLVPLRAVLERLGAFVRYDAATSTVTAIREATNITLPVGSRHALVGDREVLLDVPAFIANGSVLVPLRFMSEATRTVDIETAPGAVPPKPPAPAPTITVLRGRVRAVYPDLTPRRIVVRIAPVSEGEPPLDRTIPLRGSTTITARENGAPRTLPLGEIAPGDTVEIRQTSQGVAASVEVIARAGEIVPAPPPTDQVPVPPPTAPPAGATVFRGEFLEASRIGEGRWVLKMTDGRLIEVADAVLVLYGGEKITVDDLRSGDQLTISVDPKTKRGTRIVVAVEK